MAIDRIAGGQVRPIRSIVKANGTALTGLKGWSWDGNTLFQADTFSVGLALNGLPASRNAAWFASEASIDIEILIGAPTSDTWGAGDLESIFKGRVDEPSASWDRGILTLTGRDRTADFLDNKTSEKFPNKTSSEIATLLAGRHGLTPVVTATKTKVGAFYKDTHTRLEDDRTEWDLLAWLAREEGFIVYVKGSELHFEPASASGSPYALVWTSAPAGGGNPSLNGSSLETSRSLTVAKDIEVTVHSWNGKQKKAFTVKATRSKKGGGQVQKYSQIIPNLTPEQAQLRADAILANLSRHEMKLRLSGPADNVLQKTGQIALSGTGTAYDQTYFPDSIARTFDADSGGYGWTVNAKNHSPEGQPTL